MIKRLVGVYKKDNQIKGYLICTIVASQYKFEVVNVLVYKQLCSQNLIENVDSTGTELLDGAMSNIAVFDAVTFQYIGGKPCQIVGISGDTYKIILGLQKTVTEATKWEVIVQCRSNLVLNAKLVEKGNIKVIQGIKQPLKVIDLSNKADDSQNLSIKVNGKEFLKKYLDTAKVYTTLCKSYSVAKTKSIEDLMKTPIKTLLSYFQVKKTLWLGYTVNSIGKGYILSILCSIGDKCYKADLPCVCNKNIASLNFLCNFNSASKLLEYLKALTQIKETSDLVLNFVENTKGYMTVDLGGYKLEFSGANQKRYAGLRDGNLVDSAYTTYNIKNSPEAKHLGVEEIDMQMLSTALKVLSKFRTMKGLPKHYNIDPVVYLSYNEKRSKTNMFVCSPIMIEGVILEKALIKRDFRMVIDAMDIEYLGTQNIVYAIYEGKYVSLINIVTNESIFYNQVISQGGTLQYTVPKLIADVLKGTYIEDINVQDWKVDIDNIINQADKVAKAGSTATKRRENNKVPVVQFKAQENKGLLYDNMEVKTKTLKFPIDIIFNIDYLVQGFQLANESLSQGQLYLQDAKYIALITSVALADLVVVCKDNKGVHKMDFKG